jgi:hypothetical protein
MAKIYRVDMNTLAVLAFASLAAAEDSAGGANVAYIASEAEMNKLDTKAIVEKPITKFSDRATANKRGWQLLEYLADTNPNKEEIMTAKKKTAKVPKAPKAPKEKAEKRGRPGKYIGKTIHKLVDKNPRKEGTSGHKSWSVLRDGMTFEKYVEAGGVRRDLEWDIDRKWVELKSA